MLDDATWSKARCRSEIAASLSVVGATGELAATTACVSLSAKVEDEAGTSEVIRLLGVL